MAYPEFKPIELNNQSLFDKAFKDYPPLIFEFTFPTLYAWREAYQFQRSSFDGYIIIKSLVER